MSRIVFVFALAISTAFGLATTGQAQEDAAEAAASLQADAVDTAVSPSDIVPPEPIVEADSPAIESEFAPAQPSSQPAVPAPMPIGDESFDGGHVYGGEVVEDSYAAPMVGDSRPYVEAPKMLGGGACCQSAPVCCQPAPCCTPQRRGFFKRLFRR